MTKRALALASLVMAIPAGFACYVCLRSILSLGESMPVAMTGIMWVLTIICGLLALFPIGILIFMKNRDGQAASAPVTTEPVAAAKKPAKADSDDEFDEGEADSEELGDEPLFDADDAGTDEDFDDNFNFDDEQEEEAPKKKKKK